MDQKLKIVKQYHDENGSVYLSQGRKLCSIHVIQRENGVVTTLRERCDLPPLIAASFYEKAVRFVQGKDPWVEPCRQCTFKQEDVKKCCAKNCPREIGGRAFYEIFGMYCRYRTR